MLGLKETMWCQVTRDGSRATTESIRTVIVSTSCNVNLHPSGFCGGGGKLFVATVYLDKSLEYDHAIYINTHVMYSLPIFED